MIYGELQKKDGAPGTVAQAPLPENFCVNISLNRLTCIGIIVVSCLLGCEAKVYTIGKNTIEAFGDGRFQIAKAARTVFLADRKEDKRIVEGVVDWLREGDWVYVLDRDSQYTILNYRTGEHDTFTTLREVPKPHRGVARRLEKK